MAMKLGVLGGTFDPIHLGHLHVADRTRALFGLRQIYFVVASTPPHKPSDDILAFNHRFAMVTLATAGHKDFIPSMAELEPPASPFSILTLAKIARKAKRNPRELHFIAGGDSLKEVAGWCRSTELLCSYNFIFVDRPGAREADCSSFVPRKARSRVRDIRGLGPRGIRRYLRKEEDARETRIFIVDVAAPDISSSRIQSLAAAGKKFGHLVPAPVHEYILKLQLYGKR